MSSKSSAKTVKKNRNKNKSVGVSELGTSQNCAETGKKIASISGNNLGLHEKFFKKESNSENAMCTELLNKKGEICKSANVGDSSKSTDYEFSYKYFPKSTKSVLFTNQVTIVYFNGENISEAQEPLKKEIEQQTRNKEMRKVHLMKNKDMENLCLF